MPEGPTLIILKEEMAQFKGKKITGVGGYADLDVSDILNQKITDFRTWGKHFLICLQNHQTIKIHFMLFGSYLINHQKKTNPRLQLQLKNDEINFYMCSVKLMKEDLNELYDWSADVMNDQWDDQAACSKLMNHKEMQVCDALLNQEIFAGVGNAIKNEVLYRTGIHPLSNIGGLKRQKLSQLIKEARKYSFEFLQWKKDGVLTARWKVHRKENCPKHGLPLTIKVLGKTKRKAYYCEKCQMMYV